MKTQAGSKRRDLQRHKEKKINLPNKAKQQTKKIEKNKKTKNKYILDITKAAKQTIIIR